MNHIFFQMVCHAIWSNLNSTLGEENNLWIKAKIEWVTVKKKQGTILHRDIRFLRNVRLMLSFWHSVFCMG